MSRVQAPSERNSLPCDETTCPARSSAVEVSHGCQPRTVRISEARLRKLMRARRVATQSELINTLLAEEEERLRSHAVRLQNDLLLALTARRTGTLLVTADAHFTALRRRVPFTLKVLPAH